ncbi:MAG: hypothetical protein ACTHMB_18605, partial [Candidatus Binatia bacterium]
MAAVAVAAEPASVLALAVVVAAAVEVAAAVVVLALPSSGRPTHRTAERYRLPQALRSIFYRRGWRRRRLL